MATREITQLPDRFTGDINNIRDKKIAEASDATAASDITSQCEYLIKNGQTGEFMNVLKSYIDESIRSALGALVSNLDKGSSISKVLATDANNDLGSITPANLASVLSVYLNGGIIQLSDVDLNNIDEPGYYFVVNNCQNRPSGVGHGLLKVHTFIYNSTNFTLQEFYNSGGKLYTRTYWEGWGDWNTY